MPGRARPTAATNGSDGQQKSEFCDAFDPLAEAAVRRVDSGLLGDHHRTVLARLLIILQRSVHADDLLPSAVNAAFLSAVHTLGADPAERQLTSAGDDDGRCSDDEGGQSSSRREGQSPAGSSLMTGIRRSV